MYNNTINSIIIRVYQYNYNMKNIENKETIKDAVEIHIIPSLRSDQRSDLANVILQWYYTKKHIQEFIKDDNEKMINYIYENSDNKYKLKQSIFLCACIYGKLNIVEKYLIRECGEGFINAYKSDNLDIMKYLYKYILKMYNQRERKRIFEHCLDLSYKWKHKTRSLKVIEWLENNGNNLDHQLFFYKRNCGFP